jgi:Nucleotidyl transferase of unknown function (DUF2204)
MSIETVNAIKVADLDPYVAEFYRGCMTCLQEGGVPFLVGGAFALNLFTGIKRDTKDLDIFLRPPDCSVALQLLNDAGYETELVFEHWLAKVYSDDAFIDLIFSSGNGIARVDDTWFRHALPVEVLALQVLACPLEETIWSKSYIMERERYDGADVAHLLRAWGPRLDWRRLLDRLGADGDVLLSHLVLFTFIYPSEAHLIPDWVIAELWTRFQEERARPAAGKICRGPLLSREQYMMDVDKWGYQDARLVRGSMTNEQIANWTAAIDCDRD